MTTPDRYRKIYRPQNAQEVAQMEETERWFNRLIAANASLQGELAGQVTELNGRLEVIAASIPSESEPAEIEGLADLLAHLTDFDNPHQTSPANLDDTTFSGTETAEVVGAGDGVTVNYSGVLSVLPIVPATVIVSWTIGGAVQTLAASSSGVVSTTPYVSGLFRDDGTWYLNFGADYPPDNATNITVTYSYVTDQQFLIYDAATGLYTWRTAMAADIYCAVFDGVLTGATTVQAALDIVDEFDSRYLMLDCSNDPLTASLDIDGNLTLTADVTGENRVLTVQGYDEDDLAVGYCSITQDVDGASILSASKAMVIEGPEVSIYSPSSVQLTGDVSIVLYTATGYVSIDCNYVVIPNSVLYFSGSTYLCWGAGPGNELFKLDYDGTDLTLEKYDTDHWDPYALTVGYGGTGACLAAGALGDLLVADAASTFARLSGNTSTTPKYLKQTGDGAGAVVTTEWAEVDLSDYVTTAGLTAGTIPKASDTHALADSLITESGAVVSVEGDLTLNADALGENRTLTIEGYDTGASAVRNCTVKIETDGTTRIQTSNTEHLCLQAAGGVVGIGTTTPGAWASWVALDVVRGIRATEGTGYAITAAATGSNVAIYASASSGYACQFVATSGIGIIGSVTTGYGAKLDALSGYGAKISQEGTANTATSAETLWIQRSVTLGAYDYTGSLLLVDDTTAASGNLADFKAGSNYILRVGKTAITVGVDDTGYDVTLFGATSGKYLLWDESENTLKINGQFEVNGTSQLNNVLTIGVDGTGYSAQFYGDTAGKYMLWYAPDDLLRVDGDFDLNGSATLGAASTDLLTCVGRLIVRTVNDAGMAATNGTVAEIVYNSSDSKFYGCTVTGTPATWSALN